MEGTIPVGHREAAAMSEHFASQRMHMLHQEQLIESQAARIAELEQKSRLAATVSSPSAAVSPGRVAAQPQQLAVVGSSPTRGYHQAQSPLQQQQQQQQSYAPQQQQQQPYAPQQFYASSPARQPQQPQLALSPMQGYRPQQQQQQQQQPYPATLSPLAAQGYYPQQPQPQPLAGTPRGLAAQFQPQPSLQEAPFGAVDERDWIEISGIGESPYWFNRRTRERARSPPLRLMSAPAAAPAQSPSQQRDLRDASAQRFHDAAATGGGGCRSQQRGGIPPPRRQAAPRTPTRPARSLRSARCPARRTTSKDSMGGTSTHRTCSPRPRIGRGTARRAAQPRSASTQRGRCSSRPPRRAPRCSTPPASRRSLRRRCVALLSAQRRRRARRRGARASKSRHSRAQFRPLPPPRRRDTKRWGRRASTRSLARVPRLHGRSERRASRRR